MNKELQIVFKIRIEKFDEFSRFLNEKIVPLQKEHPYAEIRIEVLI